MQIKTYAENIRRLFVRFFYTKKEKQQLNQKGTSLYILCSRGNRNLLKR